ncbi:MAG: hypothetical protein ABW178_01430 [Pseudoxanthomonas sp.]
MTRRPQDPLSVEERALAERLGQDAHHAQAQPSATLDAAILAAAHMAATSVDASSQAEADRGAGAATAPGAAPPHSRASGHHRQRRRRHWSVGVGTAAAVLLAVTLAWQLRPQPEIAVVREAPPPAPPPVVPAVAPDVAPAPVQDAETAPAEARPRLRTTPVPPAPEAPPVASRHVAPPRPAAPTGRFAPPADIPEPRPTDIVTPPSPPSPPAPAAAMSAPPPPPPPPASPRPQVDSRPAPVADRSAPAVTPETHRRVEAGAKAAQQHRAQATTSRARSAEPLSEDAAGADDFRRQRVMRTDTLVPVADDSLLSREDWLERIRTRYGLGDVLSARRSLQLFVQTHPRDKVPDDLQPLLTP